MQQEQVNSEDVEKEGKEVVEDNNTSIVPLETEVEEAEYLANNTDISLIDTSNTFATSSLSTSSKFAEIRETAQALEDMQRIASVLIKSNLCALKKESDIVLAIITGNQYGMHFMTSIQTIFPINGKPTMSIHLQRGLLIKHRIVVQKLYNFEPLYDYALVEQGKQPVIVGRGTRKDKPEGVQLSLTIKDYVTSYKFTRKLRQIDGSFLNMEVESEFKMSDAEIAGLTGKDVWVKHPKRMLDARAFGVGAKEIGSDILLGVYSISELADEFGIKYEISDSLEERVVG